MRLSRPMRYGLAGVGLLVAWVLIVVADDTHAVRDFWWTSADPLGSTFGPAAQEATMVFLLRSAEMLLIAMLGATLALPIAMITRAHARRRLRATGEDVLAPLRKHLAAPPRWLRALTWV